MGITSEMVDARELERLSTHRAPMAAWCARTVEPWLRPGGGTLRFTGLPSKSRGTQPKEPTMPKRTYQVTCLVTISLVAEVEAGSPEQAAAVAGALGLPAVHEGAYDVDLGDGDWHTGGELDGEPHDITVERVVSSQGADDA